MMKNAIAAVAFGLITAAVTPGAPASADPVCNSASCVPNVTQNVVRNAPCVPRAHYDYGFDANGNTLVCIENPHNLGTGSWGSAPPLVGVRTQGIICFGEGEAAQSTDGIPILCEGQHWVEGDDIPRP